MSSIKLAVINLYHKIRQKFKQLVALRASKHQIAFGIGVGVFIGVFPTFGLGALAIALLAPFFKFNIPAALIGTLIANPFTMPLWIFLSCWVVGIDVSMIKSNEESLREIFGHYSNVLLKYLIGVSIVSICSAVITYFVSRIFLQLYFERKKKRRQNRLVNRADSLPSQAGTME